MVLLLQKQFILPLLFSTTLNGLCITCNIASEKKLDKKRWRRWVGWCGLARQ